MALCNTYYGDEMGETPVDIRSNLLSLLLVCPYFKRQFIQSLDGKSMIILSHVRQFFYADFGFHCLLRVYKG